MKFTQTLFTAVAISCFAYSASAQTITLGFDNNRSSDFGASSGGSALSISGTGTSFQDADELETASFTISGAPLTSPFSFTMTADDTANTGDTLEIDGTGLDVDGAGLDTTETITFIFSADIIITELDFANIDPSTFAGVTIAGSAQTYGNSTNDSHTVNLALSQGQSLVFDFADTDGVDYDIQSFTFTVVPEPNTYALLVGFCALGFVMVRRRSMK